MAESAPWLLQECFSAQGARLFTNNLVCGEGVANLLNGSLLVTTGGSGLNLSVAEGGAFIDSDVDDMGMYSVFNDGAVTLTATAANATNPRIDQVIATVNDSQILGVDNDWVLSVLAGTPTGGATLSNKTGAAALPDRAIRLAYVLVPATFTGPFVNATHILDARTAWSSCGTSQAQPYVELEASALTAISNSGYTKVALATTVHNDDEYFSVSSSVVTILVAGLYQCNAAGAYSGGVAGARYFAISKNGTTNHTPGEDGDSAGSGTYATVAGPAVSLAVGDTIQFVGNQTGQASLNTVHSASVNVSRMTIRKIG